MPYSLNISINGVKLLLLFSMASARFRKRSAAKPSDDTEDFMIFSSVMPSTSRTAFSRSISGMFLKDCELRAGTFAADDFPPDIAACKS